MQAASVVTDTATISTTPLVYLDSVELLQQPQDGFRPLSDAPTSLWRKSDEDTAFEQKIAVWPLLLQAPAKRSVWQRRKGIFIALIIISCVCLLAALCFFVWFSACFLDRRYVFLCALLLSARTRASAPAGFLCLRTSHIARWALNLAGYQVCQP
jgi:hypothetical protein